MKTLSFRMLLRKSGTVESILAIAPTVGGEKQRTAIIRALTNNPKIILADEPTTSLDDENSTLLMELLNYINKERSTTIILATTDLYEKLPTNRDYVLKDGCLHETRG